MAGTAKTWKTARHVSGRLTITNTTKKRTDCNTKREGENMSGKEVAVTHSITPMDLIARAQASDASIEKMEQLFALQLKWEENEAKKAYFHAVAGFKAESVDIIKNKKVSYGAGTSKTEYNHAELGQIVILVTPLLSKHGLSHHWEYEQKDGKIKVTCFLTHEMGYEKSTSLEAAADTSGGKNAIQAIGSTTSYLERYTFLAMTGLASREQDDDGRKSAPIEVELITEAQVMDLISLAKEVGADIAKFCTFYKIEDMAYLPAAKFASAVKNLEAKRGGK
jgi:hypothetical protein